MQRADIVSAEEPFKELELLGLQKRKLRGHDNCLQTCQRRIEFTLVNYKDLNLDQWEEAVEVHTEFFQLQYLSKC